MQRVLMAIALIIAASVQDGIAASVPLPQTGQTECFNAAGEPIPCSGTGQDGEYKAGVPLLSSRFTARNGVLTDHLTGLMWSEDANVVASDQLGISTFPTGAVTWAQALEYVKKMNQEPQGYKGYSDWRLPNVNELESLVNQTPDLPSNADYLWDYFWHLSNGQESAGLHDIYWSSTSLVGTEMAPLQAWIVNLQTGSVSNYGKSNSAYILPVRDAGVAAIVPVLQTGQKECFGGLSCSEQDGEVRAGLAWDVGRFSKVGGTVADLVTDLVWIADGENPSVVECGVPSGLTWEQALTYVHCLNTKSYADRNDWRLPNRKELASIAVNGSEDNISFLSQFGFTFPEGGSRTYWTSSSYLAKPWIAWTVGLSSGGGVIQPLTLKYQTANVWPVRGGKVGVALPSLAPEAIDLDTVETTELSPPFIVTLANAETAGNELVVNTVSVTNGESFSVAPGGPSPCSLPKPSLSPGQACTLAVTFHPVSTGDKSGELRVAFAGDGGMKSVSLTGKGKDTRLWVTLDGHVTTFTTKTRTQQISGTIDAGATVAVTVPGRQPLPVRYEKGKWYCTIDQLQPGTTGVSVVATDGTNITEPLTVNVTYQPVLISGKVATEGGAVVAVDPLPASQSDPVAVPYKGKATFSIVPSLGFHVDKVVLDDKKNIGKKTKYTFTNVKKDHSLTAWFARNAYSVKISAGRGGTITRSFKALYEETPSVTVIPKVGYEIATVVDVLETGSVLLYDPSNPPPLEPDGSFIYRFNPINDHHRIKVTFRKLPVPLPVSGQK